MILLLIYFFFFFFNDTATTEIYTLSLHDALPIYLLQAFSQSFWKLYQNLLAYRDHPSRVQADACRAEFDQLFGQTSGYQQLDERKARTLAKKEPLLMVLSHPEILLHNNPAELGARQRVRKRDVSLQARTREGNGAWDTLETLVR